MKCNCSKESCNHVYGCHKSKGMVSIKCFEMICSHNFQNLTRLIYFIYHTFFSVCDTGNSRANCTAPCVYPSYGKDCHLKCSCSNILCHHVYGCFENSEGTKIHNFPKSVLTDADVNVLNTTISVQVKMR